jgi:hypothetical protein
MIITVVCVCRQEAILLPFFIRHYRQFADRLIFYDGMSTDDSREIIKACPIAELRDHDTGGLLDDASNIRIKNECYQAEPGEWFILTDADEFIYHPRLRALLEVYEAKGVTLPRVEGWNMIGDSIPPDSGLLTSFLKEGIRNPFMDKCIVVHSGVQMNYEPGAHVHHASPHVESVRADLKLLHYKYLSPAYVAFKASTCRMSDENHKHKYGYDPDGRPSRDTWLAYYFENVGKRVKVIE